MVISHDRAFCEAIRCTHVAYVADGRVTLEERSLRPGDFGEAERGVANLEEVVEEAGAPRDRVVEKAAREAERRRQKALHSAPKQLERVQAQIEQLEAELVEREEAMMAVGSDAAKALELSSEQQAVQARIDALYEQWEELEELLATAHAT